MTDLQKFNETIDLLESGKIRVAEKINGEWTVNSEIKNQILTGFRIGNMTDMSEGIFPFFDKDTVRPKTFSIEDGVRIVPGGSAIRRGAYLAKSVVVMPPSYINIGAFVDEGTMIDSHALVGSCAQVGKNVHLSAASQLGGVLEPIGALPVIVEDDVFIGGNCGIYEGTILQKGCVIGTGVIINRATIIYDSISGEFIKADAKGRMIVPERAVVIAGSRPLTKGPGKEAGIQVYTPVIIKYRDSKTSASVTLEEALR